MAGIIALTSSTRWTAASWLFDWTLNELAINLNDHTAVAHLREIIDNNLGWLDLGDLSPDVRSQILHYMQTELVVQAKQKFPATIPERDAVMELLQELSTLAAKVG